MRVAEVRRAEEFQALKPAWDALLRESSSDTIFLTWEWLTAWWSAYGSEDDLYILAAFDETETLRGIAPLRRKTACQYRQRVHALSFVGDGSNDSDYMDFIVAAGYEQQVLEAFRAQWRSDWNRGTVLMLNEIPETSPNLAVLQDLAKSENLLWDETDVPCGVVPLPQSWEQYLKSLRSRFRTKVRSLLRELEAHPDVRFGFCETEEQVQRMLPILFDLHKRRWAVDGKPGVFGWDRKRAFYLELSPLLLKRGWLRFGWLEWKGRILACQYGFVYREKYFLLQEGYEPASEHWNPGVALRAWSIREFIQQHLLEYDFLGGRVARHRSDWGALSKNSKQVRLAAATYKNLLFCRGPKWEASARETVKKLLPDKVLAARRALSESAAASGQITNGHGVDRFGHDWLRRAASNCYVYSGLPALTSSLQNRYSFFISSKGRWPRISYERRMEPSARILYFHRVNADLDPFFPSMTTKLFEEEMRFLARYKKVVSLANLVKHLEGDSTEPVFAITFDDGYQDNCENAFPILQRYGLPATIFLTTGSMDSREPLWFEQLALALKTTGREFIDMEVDLPRRFWLRTQSERLGANDQIFGLLRGLQDADRRELLAQIYRQLETSGGGERQNKMLTWDQVRLMQSQGIDFGGHTVDHPFISRLSRESIVWEVSECKRRIEDELQTGVDFFAYPNGREEDFGLENKELIRSAGYRAAVTTIWGTNYRSTDRMELRRGQPWEENAALFASKLDWYQLVNG
jgi:peptidoglycan/xylan/chitin deacetylase (PgdA/CDA1 family)/CelD/BcsL family acetyltransferase involved in cellulose biosynthesis